MRKVLFIAYDFPPCSSVGGSLRSEKFVKYLPEFGWTANVISFAHPGNLHQELYSPVTRVSSITPWESPYNLVPYGWLPKLYKKAKEALERERYDLIYVSCPPFPQTTVASSLKKKYGVPLAVDFRDAWSLNPYVEGSLLNKVIFRTIFPALERRVLFLSDGIILNTPSALTAYQNKYPQLKPRMTMIPNGYDEEDFINFNPTVSADRMTLVYCGRFDIGARDPLAFFKAINNIIVRGRKLRLRIVGDASPKLWEQIRKLNLQNHIQLEGQKPHRDAIMAMGSCHVLVLYQEKSKGLVTPVAGKTYEYLRAGRAILAIAPPGDNIDIIHDYSFRHECVTDHDLEPIERALESLYADWEKGVLNTNNLPDKAYTDYYNRHALTNKLANYFNNICDS